MKNILYIFLFFALAGNCFGQKDSSEVFTVVEAMPEFQGGVQAMMKFMMTNFKYPKEERNKDIQGKTYVKFIVEKDGSVSNPEIAKSSGNENLDKEALRIVSIMPKWTPGMQNGKTVKVYYMMPINFKLND